MVIANTNTKSVFNANGVTREWPIDFVINQDVSKINILLEDASGEQTEVTTGYSLENNVVTYPTLESGLAPVAEGNKVIIFRTTPLTQEKDLADNIVESGLDKLTLQVQEISEQVGRAIKAPISEDGLSQYKNPITEIREETKKSLDEIQAATEVVSSYTTESATNAATSKEEADRAVEASNISEMASSDAEAAAVMAENLSNEAKDAVSAYVNGLGAMRNSVIDLGVFESNQRRASSCIIDFDFEPLDVFIRFSDSERKMWIKGSHSFAGFEKIGDKKYKIFYSVSSEDFASQNAIKGPFYVQYVIKYSAFSGKPVTYRGRVDTVDQLPETAEDGDLWYVGPIEQSNKEEYIWQEGKWELLGSTDFSRVYSKEEIDNKVSVIENSIKNDIKDLGDQVSVIESKIPNDATEQNQLVTKTQMETAVAGSSGFDFEGTKAEFDAAVAAGTITDDSVSLITDDVSGDNVATKAELQAVDRSKMSKAGDTMSGNLNLNARLALGTYKDTQADIKFSGVGGSFYQIVNNSTEEHTFFQLYDENARGFVIIKELNSQPFYFDGTNPYRLLTTADLPGNSGSVGFPNYGAAISFATNTNFTAPADGVIHWWAKTGQGPLFAKINDIQVGAVSALGGGDSVEYTGTFIVKKGDIFYGPSENPTNTFYPFR